MSDEPTKSLFNIKDVAGLSQPITKLIDTFRAGCGNISDGVSRLVNAYMLAKKDADNEAYRIQAVSHAETQALTERAQAIADLTITTSHVEHIDIITGPVQAKLTAPSAEVDSLLTRANNRLAYQNALHQLNIDAVVANAAATLAEEKQVSSDPVEQDWINRFFKLSEDVSSEEMQALWGRILAEEVKKPSSFSLRTLQVLSNMTKAEALDFQRLCAYNWVEDDGSICNVLVSTSEDYAGGLTFAKLQHLDAIGLIKYNSANGIATFSEIDESRVLLTYNGMPVKITEQDSETTSVSIGHVLLTQVGAEIASICTINYDAEIFEDTLRFWYSRGYYLSSSIPK